jgi:hypothetical protein
LLIVAENGRVDGRRKTACAAGSRWGRTTREKDVELHARRKIRGFMEVRMNVVRDEGSELCH